jgi:hypothetical protein
MSIPAEWLWCAAVAGAFFVGYSAGTFYQGLLSLGTTAMERDRLKHELIVAMAKNDMMKAAVERWVAFRYEPIGAMGPTRTVYGSPEDVEWLKVKLSPPDDGEPS